MTRPAAIALLCAIPAWTADVSVRVLELFRPAEVRLSAPEGRRIRLVTAGGPVALEGGQSYRVTLEGGPVTTEGGPVRVRLDGRMDRVYPGRVTVESAGGRLEVTALLPIEEAVAAIVAAEAGADAPPEAQKAQAIAARSFLLAAKGRHRGYSFCDTTHCQHLTEADAGATAAARATAGAVLSYAGSLIEALSTRRCGGATLPLERIGLDGSGYPYFPAACEPCRRRPSAWERIWPASEVAAIAARPGVEAARLEVVRRLGWSAVPSNAYTLHPEGGRIRVSGHGEGHGVGLCQFGAAELARQGWDAQRILAHYFLNATVGENGSGNAAQGSERAWPRGVER